VGTEVKFLRFHEASLQEIYVKILGDEIWLIGCSINLYCFGNIPNHKERRDRRLPMHKRESIHLKKKLLTLTA